MQSHDALVWIDHRSAIIIHLDREAEKIMNVASNHGKEHRDHKRDAIGDGNIKAHADYFVAVMDAIGSGDEILLTGPADAKTEFARYVATSYVSKNDVSIRRSLLNKCIIKMETLDRATSGELVDHARHYFSMLKPRLG